MDKEVISKKKFCPPHCLPHKLPIGKKITDEECPVHKERWRMFHHKTFCKMIRCKHYEFMIKEDKKRRKKRKNEDA